MRPLIYNLATITVATVTAFSGALTARASGDTSLVSVDGGFIRGSTADDLVVFKGIPFASPPVGALRWRAPQPVVRWTGTREAWNFEASCAQFGDLDSSEDCLYLNVWRPASTPARPLPVMVWIHGGGLVQGGAAQYPAEALAREGLVVVSVNYRLGRLGFFDHPALSREVPEELHGNFGYMDQIAALEWVQRNIAAFGGDPGNVTITGESAGGGSVLVLLTSPRARGLFHKAIAQSPGIPSARRNIGPVRARGVAQVIATAYASTLGIRGDDVIAAAALRALSAQRLTEGMDGGEVIDTLVYDVHTPGFAGPIVDGELIIEAPETALRAGRQAPVPVVVGANDYDLPLGVASDKDALFALFGALEPEFRRLYDPSGDLPLDALTQAIFADRAMVEPSRNLAELVARSGHRAYFYRFSYVRESLRDSVPGATHASELGYLFDPLSQLPAAPAEGATVADRQVGQTMREYWAAFMRTGDPSGPARVEWVPYDPSTRDVLNFTNEGVTFGPDPLRERLDLWSAVWGS